MKPVLIKYFRLSQEDAHTGESNSITNQRQLVDHYIKTHPALGGYEIRELLDDGFSGTNFDRPAMIQLLKLVKSGQVQCVVVKDYSRFGRNYIQSGDYLEQLFPCLGVRFISVNDHFDSGEHGSVDGGLDMAFKNLIHDLYSRDLSTKVKSARSTKALQGVFTSAYAFYGYTKSADRQSRLCIDAPAAEVVRRIFSLAGEGRSPTEIARLFNEKAILTPMLYKRRQDCARDWAQSHRENFWTKDGVTRILRDERYTGSMVSGKRKRLLGKHTTVKVEKAAWVVVPDRHEAIVTAEAFARAQTCMADYRPQERERQKKEALRGLFFCGHCGYALRGKACTEPYYHCVSGRYTGAMSCTAVQISTRVAKTLMALCVEQQICLVADGKTLEAERYAAIRSCLDEKNKAFKRLEKRVATFQVSRPALYEAYRSGRYTAQEYTRLKTQSSCAAEAAAGQLEQLRQEMEQLGQKAERLRQGDFAPDFGQLSHALAGEVTEKVTVFGGASVEIVLNCRDHLLCIGCV